MATTWVEFIIVDGVIDKVVETLYEDGEQPHRVELHNSLDIKDAKQLVENTPIK